MSPASRARKEAGAHYTPGPVAATLLRWVTKREGERLLDPACGEGAFIAGHADAVGVEREALAARTARDRAPRAVVHEREFLEWSLATGERFDCAAGNPPFIRYHAFNGAVRAAATEACARLGVAFPGSASSWAPFLVATARLLRPGGRMAFVVPAEIGHAPYAAPLLEFLVAGFSTVHVVAVRERLFPGLSQDCWLLYCDEFGGRTPTIRLTAWDAFRPMAEPPPACVEIPVAEWRGAWGRRLRPYLLDVTTRSAYLAAAASPCSARLGDLASVGIGYVSGANGFFHLRPSEAARLDVPARLLHPSVRNGRALPASTLGAEVVSDWMRADEPALLLRLPRTGDLPGGVRAHLDGQAGQAARRSYKCRTREPWYSVPGVRVPDLFLGHMSASAPTLVRNDARCTCANGVLGVDVRPGADPGRLAAWRTPFVALSCELQGHPLGGGMLKLEPGEAARVVLPSGATQRGLDHEAVVDALRTMRRWRHRDEAR